MLYLELKEAVQLPNPAAVPHLAQLSYIVVIFFRSSATDDQTPNVSHNRS